MEGGYWGRILEVDLTARSLRAERLDPEDARSFIGGSGLATKILYAETDGSTEPLSPGNVIIFATGPLTGTPAFGTGRHHVVARSPLTGIFGESDAGGSWGVALKRAGYDAVVIRGRAANPVYLWVSDEGAQIRDASEVWGKDTFESDEILKAQTSATATVACIGPAGERLVPIAAVMHDGKDARTAARCGIGAVMGSKNLKAIVVDGRLKVKIHDVARLSRSMKEIGPSLLSRMGGMSKFGTSGGVVTHESYGNFPLRNWQLGRWGEPITRISGQRMADTILTRRYHCKTCPVGCGRTVCVKGGRYQTTESAGPEYETIGTLGGLTLIDSLEAISAANELCNRLGIDTISAGGAVAFAIEAFERGLLTKEDMNGIEATWGNPEAVMALLQAIGRREGIGGLLGKGVRAAAGAIGGRAHEFAIHVKGLEFPAHDPRAYNGVALAYATSARGACHVSAFTHMFERVAAMPDLGYDAPHDRLAVEGKGEFVAKMQNLMGVVDSLKICKFMLFGGVQPGHLVEWVNAVTGWTLDLQELMRIGERIFNLKRLYNVRCGISRKDDTLPPRILTEVRFDEGVAPVVPPLGKMLSDYYRYRGWDKEGIPTADRLRQLGLAQMVSE